jgi:hypothetical protein
MGDYEEDGDGGYDDYAGDDFAGDDVRNRFPYSVSQEINLICGEAAQSLFHLFVLYIDHLFIFYHRM